MDRFENGIGMSEIVAEFLEIYTLVIGKYYLLFIGMRSHTAEIESSYVNEANLTARPQDSTYN